MLTRQLEELRSDIYGMAAYDLLKTATEVFLLLNCGVKIEGKDLATGENLFDENEEAIDLGETVSLEEISARLRAYLGEGRLPYINRVLRDAFSDERIINRVHCEGVLSSRIESPCLLELIWSYWHEEGMLVQTLNAISLRFQNKASAAGGRDPLAHMEIDPLRPLEQPAVGIYPGRAQPTNCGAAGLRVRPSLWAGTLRESRSQAAGGGQPIEVPRGVPQPAASLHDLFPGGR